jgi:N-acetylneuraminic acid mutarotase
MISVPPSIFPAILADASRRDSSSKRKGTETARLCSLLTVVSCVVAFLLFTIQGQAQQSRQVLHHHVRRAVSSGQAALVGSLPATQKMQLSIVLPLRNQAALIALLGQLYDPSSPNFRHFLSVDQFTEQFGPTVEDYQAVVDFAKSNGLAVTGTAANRLIVPISGSVAQVEAAFNVRMNSYRHPTEKRTFFSPDREPSLNLNVQVAHIAGLNNFSMPRPMVTKAATAQSSKVTATVGSGPGGAYLASDMRAAYYGGAALTGSGQTVGLMEFDGYNISDVNETFSSAGQSYSVPINNVLLDGATGASVSGNDAEETLDIVQAIGMAPGLNQVRVYIGSNDADILSTMASENIAQQLSISWMWNPDDPSTDDVFFLEFAAQGQSVFASSGDWGSYPSSTEPNYYPAEDVYVTSVGGTSLTTNGAAGSWNSETAWMYSGGGISPDGIPIPSWQAGVANTSNGGSTTLRNVPDVAAEAGNDNYLCAIPYGCAGGFGGTSFAAPRWAGFMALVDQQAEEAEMPAGGFVNSAIYAIGAGSSYSSNLHDIVSGDNCAGGTPCYSAVPGYDLVTGWGSPNGQNLIDALAGSAAPGFTLVPSPGGLSINQGSFNATTITAYGLGGFTGSVNLAISNLPSGVTATWGTNPTSGSSVLTLTASATATLGTAYLTITGSSGTLTATTTLSLTVIPPPNFTLSANPSVLSINQGVSGATTVTVTDHYGFAGPVMLVASNLPNGVTGQWGTNPTTGTGVLTLTASATAALGTVPVTITGSSPGVESATTTLALTVTPFTLSDTPVGLIIAQGASRTSSVTVNHTSGFAGSVTLAASGLPSGVTATWGTNPTSGTSVLTLTASATAALGMTTVTITGSSPGVQPATTTLALMVTADMTAANGWVWMGGGSTVPTTGNEGNPGVYGTLGVPAPGNIPGGRYLANRWIDSGGNFWLFGGYAIDADGDQGFPGDLWEFNPSTNEWAWMGGSSTVPSTSANDGGNPGVYGILGVPAAGNIPGGREGSVSWTDSSGNFWLFGGYGVDTNGNLGVLNDMWEFNPSANEWTWMGGSSTADQVGEYGALGAPAAGNIPGSRWLAASWTDLNGNFWLFGGQGYNAQTFAVPDDLWEFNPSTNQWTWMGGSQTASTPSGVYGTMGVPAAGNIPGGRWQASSWTDKSGNLWFFAGVGYDTNDVQGYLNDLWLFNPSMNEWAWMGGSNTVPPPTAQNVGGNPGVYGTLGVAAAGNIPGGRHEANSWTDNSGNLWLFSGAGYDANDTWGGLNDLWEFNTSANEWAWMGGSSTVPCSYCSIPGVYGTLGVPAAGNIPGSRDSAPSWIDSSGNVWLFGGLGSDANNNGGLLNDLWKYQFATPGFALSDSPSSLSVAQGTSGTTTVTVTYWGGFTGSVSLAASGLPSGVTASFATNPTTGTSVLTLTASSTAAVGSATITITGTSGSLTATTTVALTVNPAPNFTLSASPASLSIVQGASGTSTISVTGQNGFTGSVSLAAFGLPSGVTASFTPNPTTGSSVLTLTASSSATVGSATITIRGTSGTLTATTTLALTIPAPSFTLSDSPGTLTVVQGKSGTSTVTVNDVNGFTGKVTLAASGLPSGVTAAFATNPTAGSSVLTLTASSSAAVGSATITIRGTSGSLTATTTLALTIPAPSFTLSDSPGTLTVVQGKSGTSTVTLNDVNGFTGKVTLAVSGLPSGVTAAFATNPTAGSSVLTLTASSSATVGSATITIRGTSGTLTATTTLALTIPAPSFTLGASPASLTVAQGASGKPTITVSGQNGFTGSVTLTASGLPSGVTAAFATNPTTGTSALTLTASSTAATGTATVTIKGTSGSLTASTTIALTISCTPTTIVPYISVNGGSTWMEESSATVSSPSTVVDLGPQPTSGGSWSWTGPNKYTATSRQINSIPLTVGTDSYVATYTNASGCKSTETFTITVK